MHRSEIRLVNLDPVIGDEAAYTRPGVIVSNDGANMTAARLLSAAETGLDTDSKAQAEQVRSVATERLGEVVGRLGFELMDQLDDALRLHLDL